MTHFHKFHFDGDCRDSVCECGVTFRDFFSAQQADMKITVPDISGDDTRPDGKCWKQHPQTMWRCTKPLGHDGKHTWEKP